MSELRERIKKAIYSAYTNGHGETPYVSRTMRQDEVLDDVDFDDIEGMLVNLESELSALREKVGVWLPIGEFPIELHNIPVFGRFDDGDSAYHSECSWSSDRACWLNVGGEYMGQADDVCLTHFMRIPPTEPGEVAEGEVKGS